MRTNDYQTPAHAGGVVTEFAVAVIAGLGQRHKSIPCRFFYDARGDALFEAITQLPEYYPSRAEIEILETRVAEIDGLLSDGAVLIELGSGSSRKTQILLDRLAPRLGAYIPIDISPAALVDAHKRLAQRYPALDILPMAADFSTSVNLPDHLAGRRKLCFFPGSTIGNLEDRQAIDLLANLSRAAGAGGHLLVGIDLQKSADILVPAYNDAAGVTADFNLNLLHRCNRELGADFDPAAFRHLATYDEASGRIDMFLISTRDQTVNLLGHTFWFTAGERIHTERSQKYSIEGFIALAGRGGWRSSAVWTDGQGLFSVHLLANGG